MHEASCYIGTTRLSLVVGGWVGGWLVLCWLLVSGVGWLLVCRLGVVWVLLGCLFVGRRCLLLSALRMLCDSRAHDAP